MPGFPGAFGMGIVCQIARDVTAFESPGRTGSCSESHRENARPRYQLYYCICYDMLYKYGTLEYPNLPVGYEMCVEPSPFEWLDIFHVIGFF